MFNASTHTRAERTLRQRVSPLRRLGPRTFAALLGLELVLLVGVLIWALFWLLPPTTPLAAPQDITPVQEAIQARLGGSVDDPLVEITPGVSARASNLRGMALDGEHYYYYVEGARNFDPLSRGAVDASEVELLLRDNSGPVTIVIYRIV